MTFDLNEKQLKNLNFFLTKRVIFHGNRDETVAEINELDELRRIFSLSALQQKDPAPGPPDNNKKGK